MSISNIKCIEDILKVHSGHYKSYGDYSVTGLIDTPRRVRLLKRYQGQVKPTPESQIASFIGTGVHRYAEECLKQYRLVDDQYDVERTVSEKIADRLITGTFDILYENKHMTDIKTCKVWKLIFDPNMEEWTQQQNMYAYLLHRRGIDIKSINIMAIYMDWVESQMVRDRAYPRSAVELYELELWPWDYTEAFINNRIALHKACENLADDELPECTPEERWERHAGGVPIKYAVLKDRTAARATRVFNSLNEAVNYFKTSGKKLNTQSCIEVRYAKRTRCEKYCSANMFCNDYLSYLERIDNDTLNDYYTYEQIHGGII